MGVLNVEYLAKRKKDSEGFVDNIEVKNMKGFSENSNLGNMARSISTH